MPALIGAALAGLLLLASSAGRPVLAAGVLVVQAVLALGGVGQVAIPAARQAGWLAAAVGAGATLGVALSGDEPGARPLTTALGLSFVAAVVVQLARRDGRARLTASLSLAVGGAVLTALVTWWLVLRGASYGAASVALGLVGVATAALLEGVGGYLPARVRPWLRVVAVLAGAGAGALLAAAGWPAEVLAVDGLVVAGAAGLLAVAAFGLVDALALDAQPPVEPVPGEASPEVPVLTPLAEWSLRATLPLAFAAAPAYLLGRLLVG